MADNILSHTELTASPRPRTKGAEPVKSSAEDTEDDEACPIREHEPLDHLLRSLPQKAQTGIFSTDIDYTCLDVSHEFITLGSSVGKIFLYDRLAQTVQKLRCQRRPQARLEVLTCVRMRMSVDYVVAGGTADGLVYIFQLPSYLPGRVKQLHMFVVEGLHVGRITCLEWSPNTEKLFSGDHDGNVVCSEIDYTENQSKSFTFCQEPHPVIQLSYAHRTLLVSTTFRTVLCSNNAEKKVKRIGTKDRKILGDFGACFMPGSYKPEDAVLYCARPGLRLWRATLDGTVATTYMFRDLLHGRTPMVRVLADTPVASVQGGLIEEVNFGKVYTFGEDGHIVTYSKRSVFVLDPVGGRLLGWANHLGEVHDIAVCGEEVFILRHNGGHRRLIRLAPSRDHLTEPSAAISADMSPYQSAPSTGGAQSSPAHLLQHTAEMMQSGIMAALQGVSEKIQEGQQMVGGVPPWGHAKGPRRTPSREDPEVDSCREVSSASSIASSVHEELPSPDGPLARTEELPVEPGASGHPEAGDTSTRQCNITAQPEIHLDSDDMISIHIPHCVLGAATPEHIGSSEQIKTRDLTQHCSPSQSSSVSSTQRASSQETIDTSNLTPVDDGDIVFAHPHVKKQKRKRPKSHTSKRLKEDAISIDSLDVSSLASADSGADARSLSSSPVPDTMSPAIADHVATDRHPSETKSKTEASSQSDHQTVAPKPESDNAHLPPIQNLSELGLGEIEINPEQTRHSRVVDPKPTVSACAPIKGASTTENNSVWMVERPQSLTTPNTGHCSDSADSATLFSRKSSSPNRFEPFWPPYERSTSLHSPTAELDMTTSTISATSFHEDMNQASFESYARRASVPEMTPTTSTPPPDDAARKGFYQTPDSSDDFYSKYQASTSNYSLADIYSPTDGGGGVETLEEALDYSAAQQKLTAKRNNNNAESASVGIIKRDSSEELRNQAVGTDALDVHHQFSVTWTEMLAPGNLQSMCLTNRHIWVVDKSDRLHYSSFGAPGLTWRKVDEPARQIAVSWTGAIVWRLHQGSVYAGTKITTRAPAGLSWVEVLRKDVVFIAVDESTAWYIKSSGDVMMQKGLSRDRPSFRSLKVPTKKLSLKQICCHMGVIWAVTESHKLVYRAGVTPDREEGTAWEAVQSDTETMKVSSVAFGEEGTAWALDTAARVWFTTGVRPTTPTGNGKWWEVSISEYIMTDSSCAHPLYQIADFPLSKLVAPSCDSGGLITVGPTGVWVSQGFKHVLHICRGSLLGHRWEKAGPSGMAKSAQWHLVSASSATKTDGLVWTQQPNGAIFAFSPQYGKVTEVSQPLQQMRPFVCLCAATESVWGLTKSGNVYIRTGMASHCRHGLSWVNLDLMQLGGEHLVHLSCGLQNVWAVDANGMVYLRIGNQPPDNKHLNPAWVPVEGNPHQAGARFTKVFTGSVEWMVWAMDSKKSVYVRKGVTDSMPIGTHWLYIPGTLAEEITLSERLVYALSPSGELLIRYSVQEENPAGDYWKKVPGAFRTISVTAGDDLWGINLEGQLSRRTTNFLKRKEPEPVFSPTKVNASISDDWEVI